MGLEYIKTVPNQRIIEVNKAPTDKQHLYTTNNLSAIDGAAADLQSAGGFKLYVYLAKNQNKYTFALSSADFRLWSGLGIKAYNTAFAELLDKGYLVQSKTQSNVYAFFDKKQQEDGEQTINIVYPSAIGNDFIF